MNFLTDSGNGMLYLLGNGPSVLASNHLQEQNYKLINVPEVLQSSPEGIPPALVGEEIMFSRRPHALVVCESVVDPPDTSGHVVRNDTVHAVVTTPNQQEDHSTHRGDERCPVQQLEVAGRI